MKRCSNCKKLLDESEFYKRGDSDRLRSHCKKCFSSRMLEFRKKHPEKHLIYNREYYAKNKEHHSELMKQYYIKNREKILEQHRQWRNKNRDHISMYHKQYHQEHKDKKSNYNREWYLKNKTKRINQIKKWRANNPEKLLVYWKKTRDKRLRKLKWIKLFRNPFPSEIKVHWHHVSDFFVVPIPKETHISTFDSNSNKHRKKCNGFIEKLFMLDLDRVLYDRCCSS